MILCISEFVLLMYMCIHQFNLPLSPKFINFSVTYHPIVRFPLSFSHQRPIFQTISSAHCSLSKNLWKSILHHDCYLFSMVPWGTHLLNVPTENIYLFLCKLKCSHYPVTICSCFLDRVSTDHPLLSYHLQTMLLI